MKYLFLLLIAFVSVGVVNAQFFMPNPRPYANTELKMGATAPNPLIKNFIKPIIGISASVSDGTQLAGGFGVSFQHDKADAASNTYVIQYSISVLGFLGTNGSKITGTGGLVFGIPGTSGIVQVGPGYDFTFQKLVLLTGVAVPIF